MKKLKDAWRLWIKFGEKFSIIPNTIILTAVYILVLTPIALIRKLAARKKRKSSYWEDFNQEDGPEDIRRQF